MNNKSIIIAVVTTALLLTGCANNENEVLETNPDVSIVNEDLNADDSTEDLTYDVIGQIIEIRDNEVHILQGDIVEIFTVDNAVLQDFYLGQTIKLFEQAGQNVIEAFIIEDFNTVHTSMGMMITQIDGTVTEIESTDDVTLITLQTDEDLITLSLYFDLLIEVNTFYEFETMLVSEDEISVLNCYDPSTIIKITVTGLNRAENGELMLSGIDASGGEYVLGTASPIKNFNLSELVVGDVLKVYADEIMESWPMQINTQKIVK